MGRATEMWNNVEDEFFCVLFNKGIWKLGILVASCSFGKINAKCHFSQKHKFGLINGDLTKYCILWCIYKQTHARHKRLVYFYQKWSNYTNKSLSILNTIQTNPLHTLNIKAKASYNSVFWIERRCWMKGYSLRVWLASIWLSWAARVDEVHCLRPQPALQTTNWPIINAPALITSPPATSVRKRQPSPPV